MSEARNLTVSCPECSAHLVVDAATGAIVSHRKAKQPAAGGKDFDALLEDLDRDKLQAEEVFEREVAALKDRDRLLEEKFKQALKRAEEEPDDLPPPRPFELD
ncbi:MAG: 2-nitropropane dioxygenase [Thermoanaerobaculia bacterium]